MNVSKSSDFGLVRVEPRSSRAKLPAIAPRVSNNAATSPLEPSALLAAAPLLVLLDALSYRVAAGRRFGIDSAEQRIFEAIAAELSKALEEARRADVWVSIAQLAERTNASPATLKRWCAKDGLGTWARMEGREWMVHYPGFQSWRQSLRRTRSAA
jgi:hypothetical protein